MKTYDTMLSLKHCESMCYAGRSATAYFQEVCERNPNLVPKENAFPIKAIRDCHDDMENTYLVRIFAVFEWMLRDFWKRSIRRRSRPRVRDLIDSVAARCYVQADVLMRAHSVCVYRNALVHSGMAPPITLSEARSFLCTFLSNLPREW